MISLNELEFQSAVIHGADDLLDMLAQIEKKNPKLFCEKYLKTAHVIKPIGSIKDRPLQFRFEVDDYVRDGAVLYIGVAPYPDVSIVKTKMTKNLKQVWVQLPYEKRFLLHTVPFSHISFRSDMRFLIRRLKDYYSEHEINYHPAKPLPLPPSEINLMCDPSDEQRSAIHTVLSSPVSYVWGAPGTGKTNVVLASCLHRYIVAEKRVLLLAPTNNAVEQVLRGLLPTLRTSGVDLFRVYRLGAASHEFAAQYPEVIGDNSLEFQRHQLLQTISRLTEELSSAEAHNHELAKAKENLSAFNEGYLFVSSALSQYEAAVKCCCEADAIYQEAASIEKETSAAHDTLSDMFSAHTNLILSYERAIKEIELAQKKNRFLFWKRELRTSLAQSRQKFLERYHEALQKSNEHLTALNLSEEKEKKARAEAATAYKKLRLCKQECEQKEGAVRHALVTHGLTQYRDCAFSELDEILRNQITQLQSVYDKLRIQVYRSPSEIAAELDVSRESLTLMESSAKNLQLKNAFVVAATFDTILNHLPQTPGAEPYSHVFIDEAGYTSLARGMIAFSCGCPVSFFGDHFQLPPICEMPDSEISKHPDVVTWAMPVVSYSNLLRNDLNALLCFYRKQNTPFSFDSLAFAPLFHTFRFSSNLAAILDDYVYHTGHFTGKGNAEFQIEILPCPKLKAKKRESINEAKGISSYLSAHATELQNENAFSVLAPYNAQVKLLKRIVAPAFSNSILTVHRAQGMEWDTVIISICDTSDAFLVDSSIQKGRNLLNTAISRTKHRLVIACDVDYWQMQKDQMIGRLVSLPLNLPNNT